MRILLIIIRIKVFVLYNLMTFSGVALALMLAGCGGSSDKIVVDNIAANVAEDNSYQHALGDKGTNTPIVTATASNGQITINEQGFKYTPNANYFGDDSATIEVGKTRYLFKINVSPVNDLPTIVNTEMVVTAATSITGQLEINDIDGDTVTLSMVGTPTQGTVVLNNDGSFTYTNNDLMLPNLSFTVNLDDGHGEGAEFTVNLSAAFSSNTDKSNYYYASNKSHLKLAEQRIADIQDDALVAEVYQAIAQGYALGSFDDQVTKIVTDNITTQKAQAEVFQTLSETYQRLGKTSESSQYRNKALDSILFYIADNGVDNIERTDVQFLVNLLEEFRDSGVSADIERATTALNNIFNQLVTDEYSNNYGHLTTIQRNSFVSYVDYYLTLAETDPLKASTKTKAIIALKEYVLYVKNIGYMLAKSGEFAGLPYHSLAPLYLSYAVQYAMVLDEDALAKDYLAQTLSYYQATTYDDKYQYPVNDYAAATINNYKFGLTNLIHFFSQLYPELNNVPLQIANLDPENRTDKRLLSMIARNLPITEALVALKAGENLAEIIHTLKDHNVNSPYAQQLSLVGRSSIKLALAQGLFNVSRDEEAISVIKQGLDLTLSQAMIDEKGTRRTTYTLGRSGCIKYINVYRNRALVNEAKTAAQRCNDELYDMHFATVSSDMSAEYVVKSTLMQSDLFLSVNDNSKVIAVLKGSEQLLSNIDIDIDDQAKYLAEYGVKAMAGGDYTLALNYLTQGKTLLVEDETLSDKDKFKALETFADMLNRYDYFDRSASTYSAENELRRRGYNDENYNQHLTTLNEISKQINAQLLTAITNMAVTDQLKNIEDVIELLSSNRQYEQAQTLISSLNLGQTETNALLVKISVVQALQEDFPGSTIASVDTDGDGKATFFAIASSADEKEQSDIDLDLDSDGDGIPDAEDPTPLG
jgi:hypothetical protein